ncbi:hypothetical protein DFR86_06765 [Acidianus sulfidivorans JP7]|uniref:Uncharacterized protein n=1 Tax=Acidianus sulfidivorans JP7 TaxID=619593 RepID=A0A2U9IMN6_9CREN|nr:putative RNA uridine N3 methyltransferase [Acidianus sulfidivorans]AWR97283.1 hypothetical protein DFR86_06765 [Acidianus sulfidivorans JP7]
MYPYPRRKELSLAIYSSFFSNKSSLIEKTIYSSLLFRALLEFRVSKLYIIEPSKDIFSLVTKLASYALSPPYLKKEIPLDKDLSKAGLLSPMNILYHQVHKFLVEGEIRLGRSNNYGIKGLKVSKSHDSILVIDSVLGKTISYPRIYYRGFEIKPISFSKLLKKDNIIIASRSGKNPIENSNEILNLYEKSGLTVVIGPPEGMLLSSLGDKYIEISFNFIPKQGVSDIRVEEAIFSTLSILNFILQ